MSKTILSIVILLVGTVSCANLPATNTNLVASTTTPETPDVADSTGTPLVQVTALPTLTQEITPSQPTFQVPDLRPGQYVLYQIDKASIVNLSALSPYTGETYSLYNVSYPARFELSPSLNRLAIVKLEQVELIDLETGSIRTIEFDYVCSSVAWSPDETKLALTCGEVFIVTFADLSIFQLTDLYATDLSNFGEVSWSPDGKWLAYNNVADPSGDDPYDGIYITDTACLFSQDKCKEQTRFFYGLLYQYVASTWSLESSQFAFLALGNIYRFDVDSMQTSLSAELSHENFFDITGLAWSFDGSQYAISNEIEQRIIILSSKDGKEASSFPIAGTALSWIKVPWHFITGDVYQITQLGDNLNLREAPSINSTILKKLRQEEKITILEGPVLADGYTWWKIKVNDDTVGWVVDIPEWYQPVN